MSDKSTDHTTASELDTTSLSQQLEAILFVAEGPMNLSDMQAVFAEQDAENVPTEQILDQALEELSVRLQQRETAVELRQIAGGWQLFTRPEYAELARKAVIARDQKKLTRTALETLAIIAYKQPVVKSELDFIRGVDCGYAIQKLLEKQLIEPAGRDETPGRPLLYRTTDYFMAHFGLASLEDLPKPKEITTEEHALEEAYRTKQEQLGADAGEFATEDTEAAATEAHPQTDGQEN